jgi:hypothetical protein
MAETNKLKSVPEKEKEIAEEKPAEPKVKELKSKEPKRKKKNSKGWFSTLRNDERVPKVAGLVLLLSALYLFVALVSYLFTWREDQDKVFQFTWGNFFTGKFEVDNYLGRLGAYLSHFFMYNGFGITSFLFAALFFAAGVNLLFRNELFPVKRLLKISLFALVIIPTTFSFFFSRNGFPFGGAVGNTIDSWLTGFLGTIGTGALLVFTALAYLVIAFNYSFHFKNPFAGKSAARLSDTGLPSTDPLPFSIENAAALDMSDTPVEMTLYEKPVEEIIPPVVYAPVAEPLVLTPEMESAEDAVDDAEDELIAEEVSPRFQSAHRQ